MPDAGKEIRSFQSQKFISPLDNTLSRMILSIVHYRCGSNSVLILVHPSTAAIPFQHLRLARAMCCQCPGCLNCSLKIRRTAEASQKQQVRWPGHRLLLYPFYGEYKRFDKIRKWNNPAMSVLDSLEKIVQRWKGQGQHTAEAIGKCTFFMAGRYCSKHLNWNRDR